MNFNLKSVLHKIGFVVATALATTTAFAQTDAKIGTNPGTKLPSAVLELESTTKGFLLPRMSAAQMNAIATPANGLAVYNLDQSCTFIYRNTAWFSLCDSSTNGLTKTGSVISLGGALTTPTTITTSAANTLTLAGLQTGAVTDDLLTLDATTGTIARRTVADVISSAGMFVIGGNTVTSNVTLGTNSNYGLSLETNDVTHLTISNAGTITQITPGQVTFAGNVAATGGLDVTGATNVTGATTLTGATTVAGATNVNTTGAAATNIGNAGSTTTVLGATNINTTGASTTTIGNSTSAVNVAGTTTVTGVTNINTTGADATTIGNAASTTTIAGNNLNITNTPTIATATGNNVMIVDNTTGEVSNITTANLVGNALTVDNGLSKDPSATNVRLGGTLMQNTSIAQAGNDMNFSGGKVAIGSTSVPTSTLQLTGSMAVSYRKVTNTSTLAQTTLAITDYVVMANATGGNITLTLPPAASCIGRVYFIGKTDESVNTVTFSPVLRLTESTSIASINFAKKYKIVSDGTDWWIYNE
jgi:hypothetical protein